MVARLTRTKWAFSTVAALVGLATVAGCRELKAQGEPLQLCRYKKVFADDFNDLSVSKSNNERARWSAHTPWNGDFGDAQFIDPIDIFADPEKNAPFIVKDGILKIRARKHDNGKWTSGLLSSADPTTAGFALMYGYFEARMKLPPGPGVWPAFWLNANNPKDDKTPSVEIDVLEYYGQFPDGFHSVWHIWDKTDPKKNSGGEIITSVPSGSLNDSSHLWRRRHEGVDRILPGPPRDRPDPDATRAHQAPDDPRQSRPGLRLANRQDPQSFRSAGRLRLRLRPR